MQRASGGSFPPLVTNQNQPKMNGINYTITGEVGRSEIRGYHGKPRPLERHKTPFRVDIAALKKADQKRLIKFEDGQYSPRFTIGFEVEKNRLDTSALKEYELFCGFEEDGSCGYEAVTHILPLLPPSQWRTKVFDMMYKAERIIDDNFSPSDERCGGHVTVAVDGMSGDEIREAVRPYAGILLALFRFRLRKKYCGANRRLDADRYNIRYNSGAEVMPYCQLNGWHDKYQTALVKGECLEFRLVSRFKSVREMMLRYELFHELLDYSINVKGGHEAFLNRIRPILLRMYDGNADKVSNVVELSREFRKFILKGSVSNRIREFLK